MTKFSRRKVEEYVKELVYTRDNQAHKWTVMMVLSTFHMLCAQLNQESAGQIVRCILKKFPAESLCQVNDCGQDALRLSIYYHNLPVTNAILDEIYDGIDHEYKYYFYDKSIYYVDAMYNKGTAWRSVCRRMIEMGCPCELDDGFANEWSNIMFHEDMVKLRKDCIMSSLSHTGLCQDVMSLVLDYFDLQ